MRPVAIAALAAAIVVAPIQAGAQEDIRETIEPLVADWLASARGYSPQVVRYARICITDAVVATPEETRAMIAAADSFSGGLEALSNADRPALDALIPEMDACIQTMDLGQPIYDWIAATYPDLRLLERDPIADCLMDAVKPTSPVTKHIIFLGEDFMQGVSVALVNVPNDVVGLEEAIAACLP